MGKEEDMLKKRLTELSNLAYNRGFVTFSDFLNLNELNILHTIPKNMFPARYETYGGYELSERQMAAFLPDALCFTYPVRAVHVSPVNKRFAEELSHRDYLGSLMNLGIDRCKLGDILVWEEGAVIFAKEEICGYIADNLTRIRHTSVNTSVQETEDITYTPRYEKLRGTVPSVRLDTVLSVCYPMSRSRLVPLIESGKVFVNGKLITSNGYHLKDGDIISVRGTGRVVYDGILSETKKGRYLISVRKYI
ncbi:YlmH/Sll1252 family protein [Lachnospiraceae bacterium 42-17]|jgi:RNA-binding protein YlmH|nr:RNA-binding protein [Dorea sp.]